MASMSSPPPLDATTVTAAPPTPPPFPPTPAIDATPDVAIELRLL